MDKKYEKVTFISPNHICHRTWPDTSVICFCRTVYAALIYFYSRTEQRL